MVFLSVTLQRKDTIVSPAGRKHFYRFPPEKQNRLFPVIENPVIRVAKSLSLRHKNGSQAIIKIKSRL